MALHCSTSVCRHRSTPWLSSDDKGFSHFCIHGKNELFRHTTSSKAWTGRGGVLCPSLTLATLHIHKVLKRLPFVFHWLHISILRNKYLTSRWNFPLYNGKRNTKIVNIPKWTTLRRKLGSSEDEHDTHMPRSKIIQLPLAGVAYLPFTRVFIYRYLYLWYISLAIDLSMRFLVLCIFPYLLI